jgi:hypothetical protein
MPYRGRDSVYVESLIAWANIAAGIICLIVQPPVSETSVLSLLNGLAPVTSWAVLWLAVGLTLMHGHHSRRLRFIEYSGMASAALWLIVSWRAWQNPAQYPMTCAMGPIFCWYSAVIYFYQSRTSRGRPAEQR